MSDKPNIALARTMGPRQAAEFLRDNFTVPEQLAEIQRMLQAGGHVTNLAHGIAIELDIDEHEELKTALVTSLKMKPRDLSVGYGGTVGEAATKRSEFAGKGPMFAQMGANSAPGTEDDDDEG